MTNPLVGMDGGFRSNEKRRFLVKCQSGNCSFVRVDDLVPLFSRDVVSVEQPYCTVSKTCSELYYIEKPTNIRVLSCNIVSVEQPNPDR